MNNLHGKRKNKLKIRIANYKRFCCCLGILLVLIILFVFKDSIFKSSSNDNVDKTSSASTEIPENSEDKKDISFTITAIGDTLCHNTQYWDAYVKSTKKYDFSYVYTDIKKYTKAGDLTIGNIETSFAGSDRGYSNYPTFNSPDSLATALKNIGVDIITQAGNHALDYGYSGICRTIDVLDKNGIKHLGTYKTAKDQKKIFIEDVKGVKIAFINYTYGTNGIPVPEGKEYCINLIDKDLIKKQIEQAKEENVDMIIACMHWGLEYHTTESEEQDELADFLFENGVDVILGNHPHCLQPMKKKTITLEDGTEKDVFVSFALGNFTADQREEITRDSAILNLHLTLKGDGKLSIDKATYTPIYMYKNPSVALGNHKFKILDLKKTIKDYESGKDTSIGASTYKNLKTQLKSIKSILGKEIK